MATEKRESEKRDSECVEIVCGSCIWSRPCLCCCCPPTRESRSARGMYTVIFAVILVIACLSHELEIHNTLVDTIGSPQYNSTCLRLNAGPGCARVTGFRGVYRLCAVLFFFHALMGILTICVYDSRSARANLHNGFWGYKIMFLAILWAVFYVIPQWDTLINVWKYVGIVCAFLFVLLQQISLIDCAYALNNYLGAQSVTNCCYGLALYGLTCIILAADVVGYTFLWYLYTSVMDNYKFCLVNFIFLIVNGCLALGLCIASFFVVRKGMHMWLQGPFMVTYSLYLTWSAMANQPPRQIPASLLRSDHPRVRATADNDTVEFYCRPIGGHFDKLVGEHWSEHIMIYCGIFIMLCFALYSSLRTAVEHEKFGIQKSRSNLQRSLASLVSASRQSLRDSQYSLANLHPSSSPLPPSDLPSPTPGPPRPTSTSSTPSLPLPVDMGHPRPRNGPLIDKRLERVRRSQDALFGRRRSHSASSATESAVAADVNAVLKSTQSGDDVRVGRYERQPRAIRAVRPKRLSMAGSAPKVTSLTNVVLTPPRVGQVLRDEFYFTRYNYSFFHLIFALASLFVMAQLTNWVDPVGSHLGSVGTTWMTVWFKMGSCWSAFGLFGWSLMCSRLGCGRDLVDIHRDTLTRNKQRRESREQLRRARSRGLSSQNLRSPDREPVLGSPDREPVLGSPEEGELIGGSEVAEAEHCV